MRRLFLFSLVLLLLPAVASAHPGRVDRRGCHTEHRTGDYHCHPERAREPRSGGPGQGGRRRFSDRQLDSIMRQSNMVQTGGPTGQARAATNPRVTDGDTLQVTMDGKRVTVRLYGIDAPEGKQPGGEASTAALRALVAGQQLAVVPYGQDRYGRTVAVVYTNSLGKTTVNQALLDSGHAWYFEKYCTTTNMCEAWRQSERRARAARRGIWGKGTPVAPWDWREGEQGKQQRQARAAAAPVTSSIDYTVSGGNFACRELDDLLHIMDLAGGNVDDAVKLADKDGRCAKLPAGAAASLVSTSSKYRSLKKIRLLNATDAWWIDDVFLRK